MIWDRPALSLWIAIASSTLTSVQAASEVVPPSQPEGVEMQVPGGRLDPAFPDADVFMEPPPEPPIPAGRACALAARYVQLINAGDYPGVAALYADDASFLEPMRPSLHGRVEIDAFYAKRIGAMAPNVRAVRYLGDDRECMVALSLRTEIGGNERFVLVSVDHFTLDDHGRISSMVAYARPARGSGKERP